MHRLPGLIVRGLSVTLAALATLAIAPAAGAAANPVARPTCTGPASLGCVPCPVTATDCADPTGQVAIGARVRFDGSASSATPPRVIEHWKWTFSDGSTINSTQPVVEHGFGRAGTFVVTLEVTDDQRQKGSSTIPVVVGARLLTTPSPAIVLGAGTLTNSATVIGRVDPAPGATIDFRLYGPDDAQCARAPAFEDLGVAYPLGGASVTSRPFTPALVGAYRWTVSYGADPDNAPSAAACGASVLVRAPPPPPPPVPPPGTVTSVTTVFETAQPPPAEQSPALCFGKPATIAPAPGRRAITGTPGADVIIGGNAGETIDGRGGNDIICARGGDDTVRGSAGNDRLYGGRGADLLLGGGGADNLYGQAGKDRIGGGAGSDRVVGGSGNDLLDDQGLGGEGADRLLGGTGSDRVRAFDRTGDSVDCGTGRDSALLDRRDRQRLCDGVRRGR